MIALAFAAGILVPETSVAFTIDPKHRLVEGVASDGETLFVSSVLDRTIISCAQTCADSFTLEGRALPLGITWDAKRKLLWVAMQCPNVLKVQPCPGEVRGVTRAGKVRYRISMGPISAPGDLSMSGKLVIVSDSSSGQIYSLNPAARRWIKLIGDREIKSAQGTAVLEGGEIIASDYSKGLSRLDLRSRKRTMLLREDGRPLRGIDGMVADRIHAYAIYNGQEPGKLVRIRTFGKRLVVDEVADLPDPTQIVIKDRWLYFVTNSGWASIDRNEPRSKGAEIRKFPLAVWD